MKGQGNLKLPKLHRWTVLHAKVSTFIKVHIGNLTEDNVIQIITRLR